MKSIILTRTYLAPMIVAFAASGAWMSGSLLAEHTGGWDAGDQGTGFLLRLCESSVSPGGSCATVLQSRFGSFDFYVDGRRHLIPTAFIGLAYFVTVVIWFAFVPLNDRSPRWTWIMTLTLVAGGLSVSLLFMGLMAYSLDTWCTLCVMAHGCNAGVFALTLIARRRASPPMADSGTNAKFLVMPTPAMRPVFLAIATAVTASLGTWAYFDASTEMRRQWRKANGYKKAVEALQSDASLMLREFYAQPVDIHAQDATVDSEPTLIIFQDFNSTSSACFKKEWYDNLLPETGNRLRVSYRNGPRAMMSSQRASSDPPSASLPPGFAAEAARLQGHAEYLRMSALLYRHRKDAVGDEYAALARRAGLDVERFRRDLLSEEVHNRVRRDVLLAEELNVTSTPTLFLDGRRVPNLCVKSPTFWKAVTEELSESKAVAYVASETPEDAGP